MSKANPTDKRGRFIVLEGIDGAGTTTQARHLVAALKRHDQDAFYTCEPTGGPIGALIRQALSGRVVRPTSETEWTMLDADTMTLLFSADRLDHAEGVIKPALEQGRWVICDRYYLSTLAYQGVDGDTSWIRHVNGKAPKPDWWIFLDVPPKASLARLKDRDAMELYEKEAFLNQVDRVYKQELKNEEAPLTVLDGLQDEGAISEAIWAELLERFEL